MTHQFSIEWIDRGREPQCDPNPEYPEGKDVEIVTDPFLPTCETKLPYPAKRCGLYEIVCVECGFTIGLTTAGRPDDPRSLKITCMRNRN